EDTRGTVPGPIVVILTFNDHEFEAVREHFNLGPAEQLTAADGTDAGAILGRLGELTVLHVHSLVGQGQVNASILTTNVIHRYRPALIVGVGIAMGLKDDQEIGDVLVSTEVRDTEMCRINADGSVTPRGRTFPVEPYIEKICKALCSAEKAQ